MRRFNHHFGLFTSRPKELQAFYEKKLGFKFEERKELPAGLMKRIFGIHSVCELVKLSYEEFLLEIFSPADMVLEKRNIYADGYNHWGMRVEDLEEFIRQVEKKGVNILKIGNKGSLIFFIKDPDGNLFEVQSI